LALNFAKSKRPSEVVQESISTWHQQSHNVGFWAPGYCGPGFSVSMISAV